MPELSRRVGRFTDSVIRRMTRISDSYGAINLSQGFPDFNPPEEMLKRLAETSQEDIHQYAITFGAKNLREAICYKKSREMGRKLDPETEIVITCGSTEAMMATMLTICNPGDKVMIFSPFYENYGADTILSGAQPIYIPLVPPEYKFDINLIEEGFKEGAKAIIICNPSNPCGKVFTREELEAIGELLIKYDAFAVMDEVYEYLVYEPAVYTHMAGLPGLFDHVISCNSLSKSYSATGWRIGYITGSAEVIDGARKVHDFLTVGAAAPLQEAAVTGLELDDSYYVELQKMYKRKRDFFIEGLDRIGLKHNIPEGAYFVMVDISDYMKFPQFEGYTDLMFCEWMVKEIGVAAVPGSSFFDYEINNLIRLHFSRSEEVLAEVIDRLEKMTELLK